MSNYFQHFPIIEYDMDKNKQPFYVTNIMKRFAVIDSILKKAKIYYKYEVQEGEQPYAIADKYYKDINIDWLIWIFNLYIDPYFEWVLHYDEFNKYIIKKYGSIETAQNTVHHYEQILQPYTRLYDR